MPQTSLDLGFADSAAPLAERLRPEDARRGHRPAPPARPGQAAARRLRVGQAALDDPVGPARRRQDDAGAPDGRCVRRASSSRCRRCSPASRTFARRSSARRRARTTGRAHDPLRRRGPPLQQGAAGRVPAVRRVGPLHLHRRDHREPVVRGQLALLSRATVYVLEAARRRRAAQLLDARAGDCCAAPPLDRRRRAMRLIGYADGDGRRLLNPRERSRRAAARTRSARRSTSAFVEHALTSSCAASTRAASRSTTRSRRCTSRCAARDPDASLYWFVPHARRRRRPALRWRGA